MEAPSNRLVSVDVIYCIYLSSQFIRGHIFPGPFSFEVQLTPDNSNLLGKSKKVLVIGSSKQITENKEIRKWDSNWESGGMQVLCTLHFNCFFSFSSSFFSASFSSFLSTGHTLKTWIELSKVKLYRNALKANKKYLELVGVMEDAIELPRVKL